MLVKNKHFYDFRHLFNTVRPEWITFKPLVKQRMLAIVVKIDESNFDVFVALKCERNFCFVKKKFIGGGEKVEVDCHIGI